jgi:ribonucleoside-triphosphate reductase
MHLRRFESRLNSDVQVSKFSLMAAGIISEQAALDMGEFASLKQEITHAFDLVKEKRILPSMRSLQFGGKAVEAHEARIYNCTASPVNRLAFFREYFYLLLAGAGCGFSVQKHHVATFPSLRARPADEVEIPVQHHTVGDTIEGWAMALEELIKSYIEGYKVEFSYSAIRPRGTLLKTSGGRAPGHIPLKNALNKIEVVLANAAGRSLRPIELYDICMFTAKAVLSGGIRRSATICLFSPDDEEMMSAKSGQWWDTNPQRSASNNSAVLVRDRVSREMFNRLFECQKAFGEPGFFFVNESDQDVLTNPCVEIGLNPRLVVTKREIEKLRAYGYEGDLSEGQELWGWQFCNLTTISGTAAKTPEHFFHMVRSATLIGTLQASYTHVPFLGPITRVINEREALIGVSICGVLDNPSVLLDPKTLRRGAEVVKATNALIASVIGINRAARTTCVKPEGTSSLVLNAGSGIHPHHARRYFRRVQAATTDRIYQAFKAANPHMVEPSVYGQGTDVISFPVEAAPDALLKDDVTALQLLSHVKLVQENWVKPGRAVATYTDTHHNVSNTITVHPEEWEQVADFIWENQHYFTGVALLTATGDKAYRQAPLEEIKTDDDVRKWNGLVYTPVDYTNADREDATAGSEHREVATACAGGACSLV